MYALPLQDYKLGEGEIICRGGKSGKKVHTAFAQASQTRCGKWLGVLCRYFQVSPIQADRMQRCESCFSGKWLETK